MPSKKTACPSCWHWHTHRNPCHIADCTCEGVPRFYDWVAVHYGVRGEPEKVGRPLTHAERLAVTRELLAHGKSTEIIAAHMNTAWNVTVSIIKEVKES